MIRLRLKTILYSFTIALTLIIIGGFSLWKYLQSDVAARLKEKSFLQPTEFYAKPLSFTQGMIIKTATLEKTFLDAGYRRRTSGQNISKGDFYIDEAQAYWATQNTQELQGIRFTPEGRIIELLNGPENRSSAEARLDAPLIAQYLGNEPIQQSPKELSEIPTSCLYAIMSIEDQKFLEHLGFSWSGLARAVVKNIFAGRTAQGGSTITQQLVKNYFLSSERTIKRKILEFGLAVMLETQLTKDQILETYLNIIYMGQNGPFRVHGFGAASRFYFNTELGNLDTAQCASLAAIVNNPGGLNPWKKTENLLKRRNLVLKKMFDLNYITADEYESLAKTTLKTATQIEFPAETAPYYLDSVRKQAAQLNIDLKGKKIYTGLDLEAQTFAQKAVQSHLNLLETKNTYIQKQKAKGLSLEGSLISAEPTTGLVLAAIGGRGFRTSQFNRIWDSKRQVGSVMKPIVFLAGIENGTLPTATLDDSKFSIKYDKQTWSPDNYDNKYFGKVPAYFALKNSLNAATAQLGLQTGLEQIISTARSLGITAQIAPVPSMMLGSFEINIQEILRAYLTLSQNGMRPNISFIQKITGENNQTLFEHEPQPIIAIDPASVAVLVGMMKQTIESGTAASVRQLGFTYPAAGKTGTTNENKDVWFAGFTPHLTTIVWVGYDQNQSTKLTGGSGAVPIWTDYMKTIATRWPADDFELPQNTEIKDIDGIKLVFKKGQ